MKNNCDVVVWFVVVLCVLENLSMVKAEHCLEGDLMCRISDHTDNDDLQVVALHTSEPLSQPKALNMMAEEHYEANFRPTPLPLSTSPTSNNSFWMKNSTTPLSAEEPRGRALNFTLHAAHDGNNLPNMTASHDEFDLSDVTILDGDEDGMEEMLSPKILAPVHRVENKGFNVSAGICEKGGLTYDNGETLQLGCDSTCTCKNGKLNCEDRCKGPFIRKGKRIEDPLCSEKASDDPCCSVLVCAGDTETEPLEMCSFGNKTFNRGDTFNKECLEVCICEIAGEISCKPRCAPVKKTSESCVEIPDPNDSCCKKVLCDVTLDDHQEHEKEELMKPTKHKILSATQVNASVIFLEIEPEFDEDAHNLPVVEVSSDKEHWNYYQLLPKGELFVKQPGKFVRLENSEEIVTVKEMVEEAKEVEPEKMSDGCAFKGKTFTNGEEYHDGCESLCRCHSGEMKCLKLECPTYFGVDVIDPGCIDWETIPMHFQPSPPKCCPDQVRCKNNGSCMHQNKLYKNWEQLPINVTGCEKRCYCEMGKIECQNTCAPVPALPPPELTCSAKDASLQHAPDDDCCKYWVCTENASAVAVELNSHRPDIRGQTENETHLRQEKPPSKVMGPLAVYENEAPINNQIDFIKRPSAQNPQLVSTQNGTKQILLNNPGHRIAIHGGTAQDHLLKLLQQHPEISDLPSGSVLEIHELSPNHPEFTHRNNIDQNRPVGPPFNRHPAHPAQDISLEQILQDLRKNIHSHAHEPLDPHSQSPPFHGPDLDTIRSKTANITSILKLPDVFPNQYPDDFGFNPPRDDISVHALEAIDPHTVRLAFMVPPVIVGLHGRVEVRYTFKPTDDINAWDLQVFAPPDDLIATPSLEFDLLDLVADKEYKIKITITLRDLHNTPSSRVYTIRTPKEVQNSTLPPQIPIEPDLEISDINATWVTVVWRKFTEYELQFIDGIQLRYREIEGKIYTATPLIHRAVTTYTIENLKSNHQYEIGVFFIPFPGQHTELSADHMLRFTTANLVDNYGFSIILDVAQIKSTSVEIAWTGVPYPEDKYVNIYRAIYQSDSGKEDHSTFKIAKRDSPTKTIVSELKPGTRYRIWLEAYLTNGKIKTSNVQDFITKPRAAPALGSSSQDKVLRAELADGVHDDYYGPLVIVAILASIAILSTLILLLILVKRHNQNKAAITPPSTRISQSAYDNPTYKVEIQQETMGL
uniref:Epidermal cell surface receptor n=3 Tax=Dendroctonus ponderosae TaxID=77166 RepID=A0AAR5Q6V1_DENPD